MKFLSDILAKAGLTVDGVVTLNNTATGQTPATNDNSTKLATTEFIKNQSYLSANQTITVSGDATGSGTTSIALTLANSGVTAGTYGNASNIPTIVVDAKGRITSISTNAVSIITTLAGLSDVTLTSPSANQVLQYNGTRWVNGAAPTTYSLPIATSSVLGGIKVGTGLSIDPTTGVLTATGGGGGNLNFRTIQEFTSTAGQTTYTISGGYTVGYVEVLVNGVYISENQYTATNGTTIVLSDANSAGDIVTVFLYSLYNLGESNYARNVDTLTATAGQTSFTTSYIPGQIDVYYNGSKLTAAEYTATSGSAIILAQAAKVGDIIEVVTYLAGAGLNASRTLTINGTTYDLTANRTWTLTTANISEVTNLYYTDARARAAISVTGSGSYNSSTGVITVTGGVTSVNTLTGAVTLTTTNIAEGTNLYYTDARVGTYLTTNSYATQTYVGTQIANLVASAPSTLDTLNELAAALGNDPSFATTVATSIGTKVPQTRTITINGTAYDLSADRSWTIASGVTSFNTRTGAITPASGDYTTTLVTEGTNLYYTDVRVRAALSFVAGSGGYNSTTGVINIPTNNTQITNGANYITLTSISSSATGLTYTNTTGVFSLTAGYSIPTTASQTTWDTAYTNRITSLTTTGTSGAATLVGNVLNIPQYQGGVTSFNTRTGAITLTSSDVTTALTYTPVTNARTITINGTTYDLTANRSWTIAPDVSVRNTYAFTATAAQTTFTVSGGYSVGLVDVFINGVKLAAADFTATNGTTVVLATGTGVGNIVEIVKYVSAFTTAVETTRTLTINGTTYDLSANRTWSIDNASLGAQAQLNGTGLVRMSGTTVSYDNATYATQSYVTTAVANLVNAAPSTLDTLNELAAALGNDANFATTVTNSIATKLPSSSVSGTTNYLPKFTGTSTIGNSIVQDASTYIDVAGYAFFRRGGKYLILNPNVSNANTYADIGVDAGMGITFTPNAGSAAMTLSTSGNLGLGVIPSAWNTNYKAYQVSNNGVVAAASIYNDLIVGSNLFYNAANSPRYMVSDYASMLYQYQGSFTFYTAPSGTAGNAISFTQAMTLFANGNLSLGSTTDSGFKTYIKGGSSGLLLSAGSTSSDNALLIQNAAENTTFLTIKGTGAATFSSNLTLSNANSTTDLGGVLIVRGNGSAYNTHYFTTGAVNVAQYYQYDASGTLKNLINAGGDSYITGGNLGIGLSTPQAILDISHTAGTTNIIRVSNGSGNYRWRVDQNFSMIMTNSSGVDTFSVTTSGSISTPAQYTSYATAPLSFQGNGNTGTYTQTTIYANQNNTSGDVNNGIFIERGYTDTSNTELRHFVIGARGGSYQWKLSGLGGTFQRDTCEVKPSADADLFVGRFSAGSAKLFRAYQSGSDGYLELATGAGDIVTKLSGYGGVSNYTTTNFGFGKSSGISYKIDAYNNGGQVARFTTNQSGAGVGQCAEFINSSGSGYASWIYIGSAPGTDWKIGKNISNSANTTYHFEIVDSSNNLRMQINNATGNVTFSGSVTQNSDIRLKKNIRSIESPLSKILQTRGILYDRVDTTETNEFGFIAQELEAVLPELVITSDLGIKSIKYQNIVAVLVEAVKELKSEIDILKSKN